jgi:hypothetical protein
MDFVTSLLLSCCHNIQAHLKIKRRRFWVNSFDLPKEEKENTQTHTQTHAEENGFRKSSASDTNEVL